MKFGMLFRPQDPPNAANIVRLWEEILEAAEVAEESGFDGLFVPEHHMMEDGYLPSPLVACAAIAARTKKVDVGTTIFLLPFYSPVHVAEDAAMVDIISNGRMRLGVGLGNFDPEFHLFGLEKKAQASRFEEAIELIQRAWTGEEIDHEGKHFKVKGKISPLPVAAELWIAAMSEVGVRRAARFGCKWPTDPLHNLDVMKYWRDVYFEAGQEFGTTEKLGVVLLRDGWVGDSLAEVEKVWWPYIRYEHWFYFEQVPRWVADREPFLQGISKEKDFKFDLHRRDRLIVGSPDDCIETIRKFKEVLDMEYLVLSFRVANGPSHNQTLECVRRFGKEVISVFKGVTAAV